MGNTNGCEYTIKINCLLYVIVVTIDILPKYKIVGKNV